MSRICGLPRVNSSLRAISPPRRGEDQSLGRARERRWSRQEFNPQPQYHEHRAVLTGGFMPSSVVLHRTRLNR